MLAFVSAYNLQGSVILCSVGFYNNATEIERKSLSVTVPGPMKGPEFRAAIQTAVLNYAQSKGYSLVAEDITYNIAITAAPAIPETAVNAPINAPIDLSALTTLVTLVSEVNQANGRSNLIAATLNDVCTKLNTILASLKDQGLLRP